MRNTRTTLSIALLAGCSIAGSASYVWLTHRASPVAADAAHQRLTTATPLPHRNAVVPIAPLHLTLKLSPMGELALDEKTAVKSSAPISGSRHTRKQAFASDTGKLNETRQPPLDLALPTVDSLVQAPTGSSRESAGKTDQQPIEQTKLQLATSVLAATPQFTSDPEAALFNRDNGLRGFMKQGWVSQRVGFQGGLAIRQERLRQNDSNLQDNMAVGMGVLLAF